MARRKKQSTLEDLMDLAATAPWWVGVVLAVVSYIVLHAFAGRPLTRQPGQTSGVILAVFLQGLAMGGQFVLPIAFLGGAAISAFRRHQARRLHGEAAQGHDAVKPMSWHEFEVLVGEYFRRQGFVAVNHFEAGPDGGVDVLLKKGADRYLVQCKHWRTRRVGVQPVRELFGVMAAQRVSGGFVVTSGDFTEEALRFAQDRTLKLIDGDALLRGIRAQAAPAAPTPVWERVEPVMDAPPVQSAPLCPVCSAPMVQRQARTGPNAGKHFWGCSRYGENKCRGTRPIN